MDEIDSTDINTKQQNMLDNSSNYTNIPSSNQLSYDIEKTLKNIGSYTRPKRDKSCNKSFSWAGQIIPIKKRFSDYNGKFHKICFDVDQDVSILYFAISEFFMTKFGNK